MNRIKAATIILSAAILLVASSVATAQTPIEGALATLQAATIQAQQAQWARQLEATRRAQDIALTSQAIIGQAEATRHANESNALATQRAAEFSTYATATAQAQQAEARATKEKISSEATRRAQEIIETENKKRAGSITFFVFVFIGALSFLVLVASFKFIKQLLRLGLKAELEQEPETIIEGTYEPVIQPLLTGPRKLEMSEAPDELEQIIDELIE